jgi:lipid II:glycine glycyltransferase (peptidoglycan interpeptide bridge formation enzyme)
MFSLAGAARRHRADRTRSLHIGLDGELPVVTWEQISDADAVASWDRRLLGFDDYSIYQSMAWGEHRRALGWTPYRWIALEDGQPVAMAQGLLRRYAGGVGVVWLPGGPVGAIRAWNSALQNAIRRTTRLNVIYCRFNSFRPASDVDLRALRDLQWQQPRSCLGARASLLYDVAREETLRLAACSKNWRHNLKRSHKSGYAVALWDRPDAAEMRAVYAEMEEHKNLAQQHTVQNLRALYAEAGDHLLTVSCRDAAGTLVAFRACAVLGTRAWDMLAATAVAGRRTYASYAAFWALTRECHRRGIGQYDLSGVDPVGNRGVFDFKQGTGATPVEYLGEWEWASPGLLALPANWLIGKRRHGHQ